MSLPNFSGPSWNPANHTATTATLVTAAVTSSSTAVSLAGFIYRPDGGVPSLSLPSGSGTAPPLPAGTAFVAGSPSSFSSPFPKTFTGTIPCPNPGQQIIVRAVARNGPGASTGWNQSAGTVSVQSSTTPTVSTDSITNITQTDATGHVTVSSNGGASLTRKGIIVSIGAPHGTVLGTGSPRPNTWADHDYDFNVATSAATDVSTFLRDCNGTQANPSLVLAPNTHYVLRAYARNNNSGTGASVGINIGFDTLPPDSGPTLDFQSSLVADDPRTVHIGAQITSNGVYQGQPADMVAVGLVYLVQEAQPNLATFLLPGAPGAQAGITRVDCGLVPLPKFGDLTNGVWTQTLSNLATLIAGSEAYGGRTVWVRGFASNHITNYTPTQQSTVTPIYAIGEFSPVLVPAGDIQADLVGGNDVSFIGFCDLPINTPNYSINDPRIRINQGVDLNCTHASNAEMVLEPVALTFETPVDTAAAIDVDTDLATHFNLNQGAALGNRPDTRATSQRGKEPRQRQPDHDLSTETRMIR